MTTPTPPDRALIAESVVICEGDHDAPAEVKITLLGSTSLDAMSICCWSCALVALRDWHDKPEEWSDCPGWTIERLIDG